MRSPPTATDTRRDAPAPCALHVCGLQQKICSICSWLHSLKSWSPTKCGAVQEQIIGWRGKPMALRCDNDPEYLSDATTQWATRQGIALNYIQPGKPQQNAYVERFNRTVRYEWLSQYYWDDVANMQHFATEWMWQYNHGPSHGPWRRDAETAAHGRGIVSTSDSR
ncbi:transposase [Burkholderia glumae]|nr:transposase family protein [Burkholderia glumae]QGA38091.1 transposase [Burkholderia glumae]